MFESNQDQQSEFGKGPQIELEIQYHTPAIPRDEARFHSAARWIAQRFGLSELIASIAIVDDATIHRLNREHLNHDWPTDVISFVFDSENGKVDGELIASADTAAKVSVDAGWNAADELLLYIIHGLLHLAGLDDIYAADRLAMRAAERDCLVDLNVPAAAQHLERWNSISS